MMEMANALDELICQRCGSNSLKESGGVYRCEYCSTCHILSNGVIILDTERENLLNTADQNLEWEEFSKAEQKYTEAADKWAKEPRAWWGILKCRTKNFTDTHMLPTHFSELKKIYKKALSVSDQNTKDKMEPIWEEYEQAFHAWHEEIEANREKQSAENNAISTQPKKKIRKGLLLLTIISVLIVVGANIGYLLYGISLHIPDAIRTSGDCIVPVMISGMVAAALVGVFGGLARFPYLFWITPLLSLVYLIQMIIGLLSTNQGFFFSVFVIIIFGIVGLIAVAFIALIAGGISMTLSGFLEDRMPPIVSK